MTHIAHRSPILDSPANQERAARARRRHGAAWVRSWMLSCLAIATLLADSSAADRDWTGLVSSDFGLNLNWNGNNLPGASDSARLNGAYVNAPTMTANRAILSLQMTSLGAAPFSISSSTLTLNGVGSSQNSTVQAGRTLTLSGGNLSFASTAVMNLTGSILGSGTISGNSSAIHFNSSSTGLVEASGGTLQVLTPITAAAGASGTLRAASGGTLVIGNGLATAPAGSVALVANGGILRVVSSPLASSGISSIQALSLGIIEYQTNVLDRTFSYPITGNGTGGFLKSGAAKLTWDATGSNYTGETQIQAGTLTLGASNIIPNASDVSVTGANLEIGDFTDTIRSLTVSGSANVTGGASGLLTVSGGTTQLLNGIITARLGGGAAVIKSGSGTVRLSGANTYSNSTLIQSGTLQLDASDVLPNTTTVSLSGSTSVLNLQGFTDTVSGVTLTNGQISGTASSLLTSSTDFQLTNGTVSARLGGSVDLDKVGAGTVLLSGENTYSGATNVTNGTLQLGANNVLSDTTALSVSGGTLAIGSRTDTVSQITLVSGSITGTSGGVLTSTSNIQLQSGSVSALFSGSVDLVKSTAGTVTLTGSYHTYTGATNIDAGTLEMGTSYVLPATTVVTVSSGGTWQVNTNPNTVAGLVLNGGTVAATSGLVQSSSHFDLRAGSVQASLVGSVDLVKSTSGTVTLGATNYYAGGTQVTGGTLQLGANNVLPNGTAVNLAGGALQLAGFSDLVASVSLSAGGQLIVPSGSTLTSTGSVNNTGGVIDLNGSLNGAVQVSGTGALVQGSGTITGSLLVTNGGALAPGNSPGTMNVVGTVTWGPSGIEFLEINDAAGTSGSDPGWDFLDISGTLTITATAGNEFTLDVDSLTLANTPGAAANFDPTLAYSWTFASAAGGIVGFDPLAFLLDLSGFSNFYTGTFSIGQAGNNLNLLYTPPPAAVPEPGTLVIWTGLALALGALGRRRPRRLA